MFTFIYTIFIRFFVWSILESHPDPSSLYLPSPLKNYYVPELSQMKLEWGRKRLCSFCLKLYTFLDLAVGSSAWLLAWTTVLVGFFPSVLCQQLSWSEDRQIYEVCSHVLWDIMLFKKMSILKIFMRNSNLNRHLAFDLKGQIQIKNKVCNIICWKEGRKKEKKGEISLSSFIFEQFP